MWFSEEGRSPEVQDDLNKKFLPQELHQFLAFFWGHVWWCAPINALMFKSFLQ